MYQALFSTLQTTESWMGIWEARYFDSHNMYIAKNPY